jgi:2-octaprenyl-6-methoxyphenol hydroxylase
MSAAGAAQCDALIVGGGLVGSAMAVALAQLPVSTVLIESRDPSKLEQPSFDARVTALANGSQRILAGLGIWESIRAEVEPITDIHISEQGRLGAARISARCEGVAALGYTVENRVLGAGLWQALAGAARFTVIAPAALHGLDIHADSLCVRIERADREQTLRTRLLIAADGANSIVRSALGIHVERDDYGQSALVFNCEVERPLGGLAFERFTPHGPVAILPLPGGHAGIVWTMTHDAIERMRELPDEALRAALERAAGGRLGEVRKIGRRVVHPLQRVRSARVVAERTALIGNAAVSLHPVAGQGFNLALRDLAALAELIADTLTTEDRDIGRPDVLARYADWRRRDQSIVAGFTHALIRLFALELPGLGVLRGAGLAAFDVVPGAKSMLARHTMGRAGRLPRLACGRSLVE